MNHAAFHCICGKQFFRHFALTRHIQNISGPGLACPFCHHEPFSRKDKLIEHWITGHKIARDIIVQSKRQSRIRKRAVIDSRRSASTKTGPLSGSSNDTNGAACGTNAGAETAYMDPWSPGDSRLAQAPPAGVFYSNGPAPSSNGNLDDSTTSLDFEW